MADNHAESGNNEAGVGQSDVALRDVPPMRDLAFSVLSLLIETAAANLRKNNPASAPTAKSDEATGTSMAEARAAIDAANALLGSVRTIMENDARLAIEGVLTQLQIEYVRKASST